MSLLEENASILAKLEEEWSALGSCRQFDIEVRFEDRAAAERFDEAAEQEGSQCFVSSNECGSQWIVTASRKMAPTAANVTFWQERLQSLALAEGGNWTGWSYPPKRHITFWPNLKTAASDRAAVLFGSALVHDPIAPNKFFSKQDAKPPTTFQLIPSDFLRRAQEMPPKNPQPSASAFSQWVYSLYGKADGSDEDRKDGTAAEEDIWQRRCAAAGSNNNQYLRNVGSDWELVHNGLHLSGKDAPKFFKIDDLRVGKEPLRASPDLIYFNEKISEAIIVEIKYSRLPITTNLWPNVWAQLWCYSQLEIAKKAHKLAVVGEVWGEKWSRSSGHGLMRVEGQRLPCLRASVRRNPQAPAYDRFFRKLFAIYSGESFSGASFS